MNELVLLIRTTRTALWGVSSRLLLLKSIMNSQNRICAEQKINACLMRYNCIFTVPITIFKTFRKLEFVNSDHKLILYIFTSSVQKV